MTCLKEIRESLGLTQEALAGLTRTVPTRAIRRAEAGQTIPYPLVKQILEALNVLLLEASRPGIGPILLTSWSPNARFATRYTIRTESGKSGPGSHAYYWQARV
jgi:transcriptional regulator with XRE-family HTH domain